MTTVASAATVEKSPRTCCSLVPNWGGPLCPPDWGPPGRQPVWKRPKFKKKKTEKSFDGLLMIAVPFFFLLLRTANALFFAPGSEVFVRPAHLPARIGTVGHVNMSLAAHCRSRQVEPAQPDKRDLYPGVLPSMLILMLARRWRICCLRPCMSKESAVFFVIIKKKNTTFRTDGI